MIGIENVNEFYTNQYLAAILGSEVRPHLEKWRNEAKEGEVQTPWRKLNALQEPFFRFKGQQEKTRKPETLVRQHSAMTRQLLEALGYGYKPVRAPLACGQVPLLVACKRGDGEPLLWVLPVAERAILMGYQVKILSPYVM